MTQLKEWRESKALKQDEIGRALGVTQSAVSQWESGETYPKAELLPRFAVLLSRSSDEILAAIAAAKKPKQEIQTTYQKEDKSELHV